MLRTRHLITGMRRSEGLKARLKIKTKISDVTKDDYGRGRGP